MNLKKVTHYPKVCPECWKYIQSTACMDCATGEDFFDTELIEESELTPTELVFLWLTNEGEDVVSAYIRNLDKAFELEEASDGLECFLEAAANWQSFLSLLDTAGLGDAKLSDGTQVGKANVDQSVLTGWLYEQAVTAIYGYWS